MLVVLLFAVGISMSVALEARFEFVKPDKFRMIIPDDGNYDFVGVHYSVNNPVIGVAAGDWNYDVHTKVGNDFVHENPLVSVSPGDTMHYWLHAQKGGVATERLGLSAVIAEATTTTQAPATASTTTKGTVKSTIPPTVTNSPPVNKPANPNSGGNANLGMIITQTQIQTQGGGSGSGTGGTVGGNTMTGTGQNAGVNTGGTTTTTTGDQCNIHCGGSGPSKPVCTSYPCLIFEDNFDFLNFDVWDHDITAGGGGNWEFQYYTNNRSNSYTRDGILYLKPTLTEDKYGSQFIRDGTLDIWGGKPSDECTSNAFWGCKRTAGGGNIINPIQSARLKSYRGFNFKYGKAEIRAKMPKGEWLWPAIWLLPYRNAYGQWPASGEIDIVESRGNTNYRDPQGGSQGIDSFGSTLHFGPAFGYDPWDHAHAEKTISGGNLNDDFHIWVLEWDENHIRITFEGEEILNVQPTQEGFWKLGELDKNPHLENTYRHARNKKMAPFDQEFYFLLNVAVGGTAFFPDHLINSPHPKPWRDATPTTMSDFWNAKNQWYPTWNPDQNNGEDAAMQVDYIKVWKMKP